MRGEPIPAGMYHLVCDVLVRHVDGSYLLMRRDPRKPYGGMWEATAGGSALKGESPIECAVRELNEETGIKADCIEEVGRVVGDNSVYVEFLCVTDCDKDRVTLQEGETVEYKWVGRDELVSMDRAKLVTERMQGFIKELRPKADDMIKKTEEFLKEKFAGSEYLSAPPEKAAYRLEHTYRVANIGRAIARREGFDETELIIACLLHDISYCEEFGENGWREHGRRAAAIARPFLKELGLAEDRINDICYGVAIHVDDEADFEGERTPFALSVGDADNIDRFDVYRIHEILAGDGFIGMPFEEKSSYTEKRLSRLRELYDMPLGTKAAEELWKERLSFYITFFEKLKSQLDSSRTIL